MSLDYYPTGTEAFAAFLKAAFDITARRIVAGPDPARAPNVEAMIYLDANDRVQMPPMTPFIPMRFTATETNKRARLDRMWLECGGLMAEQFAKHRFAAQVYLPPEFLDLRPFVWKGFTAGMGYTFLVDLPYDESEMDSAVRKQIAKTASAGFVCRRATKADLPAIVDCIRQTEQRQGFAYRVTESVLQKGLEILGEGAFRVYVALAPAGGMASVRIVLHAAGGMAIDWIAGTATEHLKSGATQALIRFMLDDLHHAGVNVFDFAGAGVPGVSAAKATWGGRLTPYPRLERLTVKTMAKQILIKMRQGLKKPPEQKLKESSAAKSTPEREQK